MTDITTNATSEASVATSVPARYLSQLCKHFQHKVPVTLDTHHGRIEFPAGACELDAPEGPGALHMRLTANDRFALTTLEDVVTRHLVRFAFREKLEVEWQRAG